jgi:hypothetical protein
MIEQEKGDKYEDEYEFDFRLVVPQGGEPIHLGGGRFKFGEPEPRPLHRFPATFETPLPFNGAGLMRVESRIRKVGTEAWSSQDYPVIVEEIRPANTDGVRS